MRYSMGIGRDPEPPPPPPGTMTDPRTLIPAHLLPAIEKGFTPGSYRCGRGYGTTYQGAVAQQVREAECLLMGERIGTDGALASRVA